MFSLISSGYPLKNLPSFTDPFGLPSPDAPLSAQYKIGSERETVTPPDGMGVFDFEESGYTRQDERG